MKYHNTSTTVSNYATDELNKMLGKYGRLGYKLVSTTLAKNKYGCDAMYLFFTKEIKDGADNER